MLYEKTPQGRLRVAALPSRAAPLVRRRDPRVARRELGGVLDQGTQLLAQAQQRVKQLEGEVYYWEGQYRSVEQRVRELQAQIQAGIRDPASLVEYIQIDTTYLPRFRLEEPLRLATSPGTGTGATDRAMRALKPQVTAKFKGLQPVTVAKWGKPGDSLWPVIASFAIFGAGVALVAVARRVAGSDT